MNSVKILYELLKRNFIVFGLLFYFTAFHPQTTKQFLNQSVDYINKFIWIAVKDISYQVNTLKTSYSQLNSNTNQSVSQKNDFPTILDNLPILSSDKLENNYNSENPNNFPVIYSPENNESVERTKSDLHTTFENKKQELREKVKEQLTNKVNETVDKYKDVWKEKATNYLSRKLRIR